MAEERTKRNGALGSYFIALCIYCTSGMACLHAAQAAPTPVLTQEMYTGRTNAPAPDWTKKAPRQSTKKPPKIKGKKEKEQAQSKPSPTETQTQTQTETPANKQPQ